MSFSRSLSLLFLVFLFTAAAEAQATRTWVSGVGDDVNPCSRTAPCKTFAGAISKTAAGGEINCLDSGGFGSVTITKSLTIDCTGHQGSTLAPTTTGIIISAESKSSVVRLRGLSLNGTGTGVTGIRVIKANSVSIENTVIDGFTAGISVEGKASVFVSNVSVRFNAMVGILAADGTVYLSGSRVLGNKNGLSVTGGRIVSFKNNMIAGNDNDGAPTSTADPK